MTTPAIIRDAIFPLLVHIGHVVVPFAGAFARSRCYVGLVTTIKISLL